MFAEIDPHYKRALCNNPRSNFLVDIVLAVLVRHPLTETLKMGDWIHDELYGTSGVEHVLGNSPSMQKKRVSQKAIIKEQGWLHTNTKILVFDHRILYAALKRFVF
jgi:hypothetical protein